MNGSTDPMVKTNVRLIESINERMLAPLSADQMRAASWSSACWLKEVHHLVAVLSQMLAPGFFQQALDACPTLNRGNSATQIRSNGAALWLLLVIENDITVQYQLVFKVGLVGPAIYINTTNSSQCCRHNIAWTIYIYIYCTVYTSFRHWNWRH